MPNDAGIVWITGAGKGIGRALTIRYAEEGRTVAASARTDADLKQLEQDADQLPGTVCAYRLDITDSVQVTATIEKIESELGKIGQAVLNAGTHVPTPAADFTPEAIRALLDVNVMGTVHCLSALLASRGDRSGSRIAVVASLAGYRGLPAASGYGATKAALINMCEALRPELEPLGIVLQLINPGFVETPLTDKNDFPMPFLVSAEYAAVRIFDGLRSDRFEITFPTRFAFIMKVLRVLPNTLFFRATRRMLR